MACILVRVMNPTSRTRFVIREAARLAQALVANDVGLLIALILLFMVSALIGLWVGIILLGW